MASTAGRRKVAVGGPDMEDMVEEVGKVVLVTVSADAANNVAAVSADTFEQAVEKIRNGIFWKTNQAMSRLRLFQQMGQGSQKFGAGQNRYTSRPSAATGLTTGQRRLREMPYCIRLQIRS